MRRVASLLLFVALAACSAGGTAATTTVVPSTFPTDTGSAPETIVGEATTTLADGGHEPVSEIDAKLRKELLAMMAEDQAVRTGVAPPGDDRTPEELRAAWDQVDAANAVRMREILDQYGWPGWSLVGEDGAEAAWVLIQHADFHLDLQKRGLAMLEAAVEAEDASPGDLAYLTDRVLVAEGKPQVYGTQVRIDDDGNITPSTPIEDEDNVDERRAAAGLGTLDEYYEEMRGFIEENPLN